MAERPSSLRPLQRTLHAMRRNTRAGSRRNISAHYDLGDDFFASFLDATMMYSAAVFRDAQMTLEQAQHERLEAICRRLELRPGHRVVEIGSGWGGFAMHAARYHGCTVTTTTISQRAIRVHASGAPRPKVLPTGCRY